MRQFVTALFNTSAVAGVCIFIFLLVFSFCGKKYAAKSRKMIWSLIAVCCLVPFRIPAVWPGYSVDIPDVVIRQGGTDRAESAVTQSEPMAESQQTVSAKEQRTGNSATLDVTSKEITATDIFFALWVCVGAVLLLYYSAGYWRLKGKIKRLGYECTDSGIRKILQEETERYQLKRVPRLWILRDSPMGPFTIGVLQNMIVLPDDVSDERDLRFVLRHEILHCKMRDTLWKLFFLFVNIIHWFNPLVWMLRKAAEQDIEMCCDEAVVSGEDRTYREEYSDVIMSMAAKVSCKWNAASTGYVQGVKFIKRRFDSILNGRKKKGVFLIVTACVTLLLTGSLLHIQSGKEVYAGGQVPIDTGNMVIDISSFWNKEISEDENTLKFITGLEIILPDSWNGKTVYDVSTGPVNDPVSTALIVSEKTNKETDGSGVLFYLNFYLHEEGEELYIFETDKVLGLYEQGDKQYVLVLETPREMMYVEGDAELQANYEALSAYTDSIQLKTDEMSGFTECGAEDWEWIEYL